MLPKDVACFLREQLVNKIIMILSFFGGQMTPESMKMIRLFLNATLKDLRKNDIEFNGK